jgi:type I restriction enzyme, R subunit
MTSRNLAEDDVENAALEWFGKLGYDVAHGPNLAPGEPASERASFQDVVLVDRLRRAIERINPKASTDAREEALRKVLILDAPSLLQRNQIFHRLLTDGVEVPVHDRKGSRTELIALVDFENPDGNDWLVVNQYTVVENHKNRRPDLVIFINGLPLAVIELKDATDENATIWSAFNQLQTYKSEIPSLLAYNELLVVSDGLGARIGSLSADKERFAPWRTIKDEKPASDKLLQLQVLIQGVFEKRRCLDVLRHFSAFLEVDGQLIKILAGYHQFHAVNRAIDATLKASKSGGDRRAGVVWHTQGSGKSLTMAFYAGRAILHPEMENPTLVVLTDRNDLDEQLFSTFASARGLLRQAPRRVSSRAELREALQVASGGIIFTTIQKFFPDEKFDTHPLLSERRNIIVIADEAHRSQYDFVKGFAKHLRDALPKASFIGFTGTPIELSDKNTRAVFGDYVSVYDIQRAVADQATVPIYYESRLAKIALNKSEMPKLDPDFEEATEHEETERKEKLKTKWAALEALVGAKHRVELIAKDIVEHFGKRLEAMDGKAMIVCMSRRICVELYEALVKLRPEWHTTDDTTGALKIVMTGSATDPVHWQPHIRSKDKRDKLAKRFKKAADPFKIVIVRDMWLTGFDAPCLSTMYIDKPMRGHGLMQAIARVNRVFKDKPGGLVVDYLGLADSLRQALAAYTESGGKGKTALDQEEAVAVMLEKYEVVEALFHGFDYSIWAKGKAADRLALLPPAQDHILGLEDGKARLLAAVTELSQAFALAVPHEKSLEIRDDVAFFQAVRAALAKSSRDTERDPADVDHAVRQIVSKAVVAEGVVDIFSGAGLKRPDISILSDEFLAEVRGLPHRNLAVELLQKLLKDEIKRRSKKNLIQSRSFAEMLQKAVGAYTNRAIETAKVIEALIELARKMRSAQEKGQELGLSSDEAAFYDALAVNQSARDVLGDEKLGFLARELVRVVKKNTTIDWAVKESVRAGLRLHIRKLLNKYGYPPDLQKAAVETVLQQAELLSTEWEENPEPAVEPFRRLSPSETKPYVNSMPLYSLKVAAGGFGAAQEVEAEAWVAVEGIKPSKGLFVAQVVGESMNRRIPNGAYCVFRAPVEGSRQGRIVLVQHRDIRDPDHGGSFTVKVYESSKEPVSPGEWRHVLITLKPDSTQAEYGPIEIQPGTSEEVRVVAQLVEVLPS